MPSIALNFPLLVIAISEAFSAWVILKLWHSDEIPVLKIALTAIALIPILGPFLVLWIGSFPERAPEALQDEFKSSADVHERWIDVIREKNPVAKFDQWKKIMKS